MSQLSSARRTFILALLLVPLAFSGASRADAFRRGDASGNGVVDLSDAVALVSHLFLGADPPSCPDAADSDDSGSLEITDAIVTLAWLFMGGAEPPAPGPSDCGVDPTRDDLGACESSICGLTTAFDPEVVRLPADRSTQVAADLAGRMVDDAVASVLNSEGDAIQLHLAGTVSVSILPGVPAIATVGYDPRLILQDDGSVDLELGIEVGLGIGLELAEGIEASALDVTKSSFVFRFPDRDAALGALRSIVAAQILLPLSDASVAIVAAFEALTEELVRAVDELDASGRVEDQIRRSIASSQETIRSLEASLAKLTGPLDDLRDDVGRLEDAIAAYCGMIFEPGSCDAWRSDLARARRALDSILAERNRLQSALASARKALSGAQAALQPAVDAVRQAEDAVRRLEADVEAARRDAETAREVIEVLAETRRDLALRLRALQLGKAVRTKIEAFLSPFPGVKVEGAGAGAQMTDELGAEIRVDLAEDGDVSGLSLTLFREAKVQASAALAVGVEGGASMRLSAVLGFHREGTPGAAEPFVQVDGSMALSLDAYAVATAGVLLEIQYGAGRRLDAVMDLAQLGGVAQGLWELAGSGDADALADALLGLEARFSAQDRWIAAAVAGAGVSYLGTGGSMEGSATWADQGPRIEEVVSAGDVVRRLYTAAASTDAIELLGGVVAEGR